MDLVYFSFGVLALLFLIQIFHKSWLRFSRIIFWSVCGAIAVYYFCLVYAQYVAWRNGGPPLAYLVPPHQSAAYVFGYHFTRFALYYLISFAASVLFLLAANHFNEKYGFRFFEKEEPYLGAIAIFLLGSPVWRYAWVFYLIAVLAVAVLGSSVMNRLLKKSERFSLYYLWLPVALSVIIVLILL